MGYSSLDFPPFYYSYTVHYVSEYLHHDRNLTNHTSSGAVQIIVHLPSNSNLKLCPVCGASLATLNQENQLDIHFRHNRKWRSTSEGKTRNESQMTAASDNAG